MTITSLKDDFEPLDRGFCAALRNKEYFMFMKDVFDVMNKIQHEILRDGPVTETYFLDRTFKTVIAGQNWLKIKTLYERGLAPIRKNQADQTTGGSGKTIEDLEYSELMNALNIIYPKPKGPDPDILAFANYFRSRPSSKTDEDFNSVREMLEVNCISVATIYTSADIELQQKNPMKAIEVRDDRLRKVKSLFSRGASNVVSGASQVMIDLMLNDDRVKRLPTYSGSEWSSFDSNVGGLPGIGLTTAIGGTGGGKTLFMSSIVANHCIHTAEADLPPPSIWGWIGEDGLDSYARRAICNIMNHWSDALGIPKFNLNEMTGMMRSDPKFKGTMVELLQTLFANTYWVKAPEKPEDKLNFSIINILNIFDAKLEATGVRPNLIILDYFNLLTLPRGMTSGNTAKDLSNIAHIIDEWAQQRGVPVVTAVQASISGLQQARDGLRFFELEDQHESKSIAHSSRMVLSLLPHVVEWDEKGIPKQSMMGVKVLKNRGGRKGDIFLSNLDEGKNIVMHDSKIVSKSEWLRHKVAIVEKEQEFLGETTGTNQKNDGQFPRKKNNFSPKRETQAPQKHERRANADEADPIFETGEI